MDALPVQVDARACGASTGAGGPNLSAVGSGGGASGRAPG